MPEQTKNVLADSGYDSNHYGDRIEYDNQGQPTGRRFLCPANPRNSGGQVHADPAGLRPVQRAARQRRRRRLAFLASRRGRRLYRRRAQTIKPFNDWFKNLFGLDHRVWHRGLDNNRTQILAAVFGYQLLLRYNRRRDRKNGQIQWILDTIMNYRTASDSYLVPYRRPSPS